MARRRLRLAWIALCFACAASAAPRRPDVVQTIAVGPPRGAAPMLGVDAQRSSRSRWALPDRLRTVWQTRLPGPLAFGVAVDDAGRALALTSGGELHQLDAAGRVDWSFASKTSSASAPFIAADGTRGFVGTSGELFAVTARGELAYRVRLQRTAAAPRRPSSAVRPERYAVTLFSSHTLPRSDGNVVVAIGGELFQVGQGELQRSADVGERVTGLLEANGATLIATQSGRVLEWWPPSAPRALGGFGGDLDAGAALLDAARLVGVVDATRVVIFDLKRRQRSLSFGDPALTLDGSLAVVRPGAIRFATRDGVLIAQNAPGADTLRTPLDATGRALDGPDGPATSLLVDASGRTAAARARQPVVVVHADGRIEPAGGTECNEPLDLVPAGDGRSFFACRDGGVWLLGAAPQ